MQESESIDVSELVASYSTRYFKEFLIFFLQNFL